MKRYYFLSSSHFDDRLWFQDEKDYGAGMNFVALAAFRAKVEVLTFVLMSNHVHFVLYADSADAHSFADIFKSMYSRYAGGKYGKAHLLRRNKFDCREIPAGDERLERTIAYVIMNPVAANIVLSPVTYPWGCGACYFSSVPLKGVAAASLSIRKRKEAFHSKQVPAAGWIIGEDGYILPESFIWKDFVESLFKTARRMNYFLNNSSKSRKVIEKREQIQPSFQDQSLVYVMRDICYTLFRQTSPEKLSDAEQERLVYELRRRFGPDPSQLSRVLGIRPETLADIISRI